MGRVYSFASMRARHVRANPPHPPQAPRAAECIPAVNHPGESLDSTRARVGGPGARDDDSQLDLPNGGRAELPGGGQRDYFA